MLGAYNLHGRMGGYKEGVTFQNIMVQLSRNLITSNMTYNNYNYNKMYLSEGRHIFLEKEGYKCYLRK